MNHLKRDLYLKALGIPVWRTRIVKEEYEEEILPAIKSDDCCDSHLQVNLAPIVDLNVTPLYVEEEKKSVEACVLCSLQHSRTQVVRGRGNKSASIMVICEAPTSDEDLMGESIVGETRVLFERMLNAIGLNQEALYITPYIKCRANGIKEPTLKEAEACWLHLKEEILFVKPKFLILLGRNVTRFLLNSKRPFDELRGTIHSVQLDQLNIPAVATYSPNLLRRLPREKAKSWQDLKYIYREFLQNG